MPVWGVTPRSSRRPFPGSFFSFLPTTVVILFLHWHDWCAIPLRLGSAAIHFSMLLTMLRYLSSPPSLHSSMSTADATAISFRDDAAASSSSVVHWNDFGTAASAAPLLPVGPSFTALSVFILVVSLICFPFSLLGVWCGRTLGSPLLTSYHIASHLGSVGYLFWVWWISVTSEEAFDNSMYIMIFFYVFVMLPAVVEISSVILSLRRGLE